MALVRARVIGPRVGLVGLEEEVSKGHPVSIEGGENVKMATTFKTATTFIYNTSCVWIFLHLEAHCKQILVVVKIYNSYLVSPAA
jgi:hypothetical protein